RAVEYERVYLRGLSRDWRVRRGARRKERCSIAARATADQSARVPASRRGRAWRVGAGGAAGCGWSDGRRCTVGGRVFGSAGTEAAAPCAAGEVGDLAVHGGWAEPPRPVRSEAGADPSRRPAAAVLLWSPDH